jgi:hypothetical protein
MALKDGQYSIQIAQTIMHRQYEALTLAAPYESTVCRYSQFSSPTYNNSTHEGGCVDRRVDAQLELVARETREHCRVLIIPCDAPLRSIRKKNPRAFKLSEAYICTDVRASVS